MGVAVLSPHDCLKDTSFSRQPLISPPKSKPSSRNPSRTARPQPNRRKRSPSRSTNQSPPAPLPQQKKLIAGQIRILKRGEDIVSSSPVPAPESDVRKAESKPDPDMVKTGLLGPAPELVAGRTKPTHPDNKVALFYAGSAFFTSPPPSSVPLPAFFTRKSADVATVDDATSGLRRLLRLD
jgi:hypothetical protein